MLHSIQQKNIKINLISLNTDLTNNIKYVLHINHFKYRFNQKNLKYY